MTISDIIARRLTNHHLTAVPFHRPEDAVKHLGAVQAQDFLGAKWSLSLRAENADDSAVEQAFNDGRILRTHVMRPTWHFVLPEDIRWMLALSAARVKKTLASYDRKLELTSQLLAHSQHIVTAALTKHQYLTRKELGDELTRAGVEAKGQRLGHIIMHTELDALICSGPRRGKQFTYALLDTRAPQAKALSREESLATLAGRYFESHGPATQKDFAVWAGLTVKDAHEATALLGSSLVTATVGGATYYYFSDIKPSTYSSPLALLLSVYDEYTIAYRTWDLYCQQERFKQTLFSMGNALQNVIVIDGTIIGTWRRAVRGNKVVLTLTPLRTLTNTETRELHAAASRYAKFLGMTVTTTIAV